MIYWMSLVLWVTLFLRPSGQIFTALLFISLCMLRLRKPIHYKPLVHLTRLPDLSSYNNIEMLYASQMTVLFRFPRGVLSMLWLLFCNLRKKRLLPPGKTITLYNKSQSQQSIRELVKLKSTNMTQHTFISVYFAM